MLYSCTKLEKLDLSQNYFVGPIPDDIDRLSSLRYLYLQGNNFIGNIPPQIGNLTELRTLFLHQNQFNGTFPKEIGRLSNLEEMALAFIDCALFNSGGVWSVKEDEAFVDETR